MNSPTRQLAGTICIAVGLLLLAKATGLVDLNLPALPDSDSVAVSFEAPHVLAIHEKMAPHDAIADLWHQEGFATYLRSIAKSSNWDDDTDASEAHGELAELLAIGRPHSPCVVLAANRRAKIIKSPATAAELESAIRTWGASL